jgi:hypothetical protein
MRRSPSVWIVWLILEVVSLQLAAAFSPRIPSLSRPFGPTPVFTQSDGHSRDPLMQDTASTSEELRLLCEQESKQVSVQVHFCDLCLSVQQRDTRLRSILTSVFPAPLFFFPRRLSPSSADDDPFLS